MKKKIYIKYSDGTEEIQKIKQGDWIDLRAAQITPMKKGDFTLIPLGVAMKLPRGYEAHVVPRSSTYKNFKVIQANSMGVIDNSYCGNDDMWYFPAIAMEDTVINKGDRICQFRIVKSMPKIEIKTTAFLNEKSRGGIGSTGVR